MKYAKVTQPSDFVWSRKDKHGFYTDDEWIAVPPGEIVRVEREGALDVATWLRRPNFKRRVDCVWLRPLSPLEQLACASE